MVLLVLVVMLQKSKIEVDCNTVHIFALVKSAGAVKQKSWSEGENKEWNWGETRNLRWSRAQERSNKSSGATVKTKSETGERREIFSLEAREIRSRISRVLLCKPIFRKTRKLFCSLTWKVICGCLEVWDQAPDLRTHLKLRCISCSIVSIQWAIVKNQFLGDMLTNLNVGSLCNSGAWGKIETIINVPTKGRLFRWNLTSF